MDIMRGIVRVNQCACAANAAALVSAAAVVESAVTDGSAAAVVDAGGLLDAADLAHADVLNGIAYDAAKRTFLITGKLWPKLYQIRLVPPPKGKDLCRTLP